MHQQVKLGFEHFNEDFSDKQKRQDKNINKDSTHLAGATKSTTWRRIIVEQYESKRLEKDCEWLKVCKRT